MVERVSNKGRAGVTEIASRNDEARPSANKVVKAKTARKSAKPAATKGFDKKTIALVYDFDGTLSPKPMQEYAFLPKIGVDANAFWAESNRIAKEQGADPLITYMHLMYKKAKERGVRIDREDLVAQGRDIDFYPGVAEWFDEITEYVRIRAENTGVDVRHYLISSGLTEIIEVRGSTRNSIMCLHQSTGSRPMTCRIPSASSPIPARRQYLFRINKGIENLGQSINHHMPEDLRPIPFSNMIYFGDGDTDVPSMAVVRKSGGFAVADADPPGKTREAEKAKDKCVGLLKAQRVDFFATADYRRGSDLFRRTTFILDKMLAEIRLQEEMWRFRKEVK